MTRITPPTPLAGNPIDDYALKRIKYRVGRLIGRFGLTESDREDLQQDFILELLKAFRRFDPAKSSRKTFIARVLDRKFKHIVRNGATRMRHEARDPVSLDRVMERYTPTADVRMNHTGQVCIGGQQRIELRLDLEQVLATLPARLRRICELRKIYSPAEIARRLDVVPSTVCRAIAKVRAHVKAAGLDDPR